MANPADHPACTSGIIWRLPARHISTVRSPGPTRARARARSRERPEGACKARPPGPVLKLRKHKIFHTLAAAQREETTKCGRHRRSSASGTCQAGVHGAHDPYVAAPRLGGHNRSHPQSQVQGGCGLLGRPKWTFHRVPDPLTEAV